MWARTIAIIGAASLLGGGVGLYFAYESAAPGAAIAAWLAILAGTLALLGGLAGFMNGFMASQHSAESDYGATEVRLLIQCMGAVAAADGKVQEPEVEAIASIVERILGLRMEHREIAGILSGIGPGFDIAARLADARPNLSGLMRERIVKSCYLVMMSDRVADRAETGKIREIGKALGFGEVEIDDLTAMAGV